MHIAHEHAARDAWLFPARFVTFRARRRRARFVTCVRAPSSESDMTRCAWGKKSRVSRCVSMCDILVCVCIYISMSHVTVNESCWKVTQTHTHAHINTCTARFTLRLHVRYTCVCVIIYDNFHYEWHNPENHQIQTLKFLGANSNLNNISIWICTTRYREIWVSRFGGFGGCSNFSGNCCTF